MVILTTRKMRKIKKLVRMVKGKINESYKEGYKAGRADMYQDMISGLDKFVERERVLNGRG